MNAATITPPAHRTITTFHQHRTASAFVHLQLSTRGRPGRIDRRLNVLLWYGAASAARYHGKPGACEGQSTSVNMRPARSQPMIAPVSSRVKKPRWPAIAPPVTMYSSSSPGSSPNSKGG